MTQTTQEEKQKRRPGYPVTINKNVDEVKKKIQSICKFHKISASLLFEAIVDGLTDEEWQIYARKARNDKLEKSRRITQARLVRTGKLKVQVDG
jgi:23S rRNA maturation mini-RNase III